MRGCARGQAKEGAKEALQARVALRDARHVAANAQGERAAEAEVEASKEAKVERLHGSACGDRGAGGYRWPARSRSLARVRALTACMPTLARRIVRLQERCQTRMRCMAPAPHHASRALSGTGQSARPQRHQAAQAPWSTAQLHVICRLRRCAGTSPPGRQRALGVGPLSHAPQSLSLSQSCGS